MSEESELTLGNTHYTVEWPIDSVLRETDAELARAYASTKSYGDFMRKLAEMPDAVRDNLMYAYQRSMS